MEPTAILAICAALTLIGTILIGIFKILLEVKKNTLLTNQILNRADRADERIDYLDERVTRLESVSHTLARG